MKTIVKIISSSIAKKLNYNEFLDKLKQNVSVIESGPPSFNSLIIIDVRPMRKKIKLMHGDVKDVSFYNDFMYMYKFRENKYLILYENIKDVKILKGEKESISKTSVVSRSFIHQKNELITCYVQITYKNNLSESFLCENIGIGEDIYTNIKSKIGLEKTKEYLGITPMDLKTRLQKLKNLFEEELIEKDEYIKRKEEILRGM